MGPSGDDDVANLDVLADTAGSAYADDALDAELAEQLGGVDGEGGLAHA